MNQWHQAGKNLLAQQPCVLHVLVWDGSNTWYLLSGDVCVIHRWVIHPNSAPNSYRKCHTINVGINVLSVSSKTGTEAELQYQNDFLMEMVQESLTASQMQITLVKTKGKHEKLLLSGWSALEAEKRKWVLSIILWDLFNLIEGPKLSNSFLACWEAVKFQQINAYEISVGI